MSLTQAHTQEAKAREQISESIDPGNELVTTRHLERKGFTVKDLVSEYLEKYAKPRKKSAQEDERILEAYIIPKLGRRKACRIKRRDIIEILDEISARAPVQANRVLACTRKMFSFALEREIVESNPCFGISQPNKEKPRERVLSDDEIKTVWNKLPKCPMSTRMQLALKLLLVTAQRKNEIVNLRWEELDFNKEVWTIPSEKTKNGKAHLVPLSPLALDLLEELKNDSEWVFPSEINEGPFTCQALDRAVRNSREVFKIPQFTPHDFRRTTATKMTELGISRFDVSRVLNHTDQSVTARYDRNEYLSEKKRAIKVWSQYMQNLV